MSTFDIYFSDLTYGAQERIMKAVGITDPKEMCWDMDLVPIATYKIPRSEVRYETGNDNVSCVRAT